MSLQRTPPNVFSSDGDIPASVKKISGESFITTRKRKQMENDKNDTNMIKFEEKFDNQMQIWNKTISDCIANSIATAVNTALKGELSKITSALSELNDNVLKLNMDTINLNKSLHEVNTRLCEIEKSLSFSNERQDLFDSRLKTVEQNISQYNGSKTQIQLLENKIHTMEQQARQCNVEIANIPTGGENLISIMCVWASISISYKNVIVKFQTHCNCPACYKRVEFNIIVRTWPACHHLR
ncbi:unnamed protein product [Parnassius apollo]|uniref:(apollo) hypothetical protein n=1 Tax=Parnassius apollo TaxID=110799 RepID=A0A8S3WQE5_PARAO|nr:unnamed protein product [Parnassius apollo]